LKCLHRRRCEQRLCP